MAIIFVLIMAAVGLPLGLAAIKLAQAADPYIPSPSLTTDDDDTDYNNPH